MNSPRAKSVVIALMLTVGWSSLVAKPRSLPHQIIESVLRDACGTRCSKDELATYRQRMKFETHDLNGDGVPEFFVYIEHHGWCGISFNCNYWVFQGRGNTYRLIAGDYPVIRVASTLTNGFRDLESQGHMGGCIRPDGSWGRDIYLTVFKYTGKEYHPTEIGERCRPK